jgi:hypothetical protein
MKTVAWVAIAYLSVAGATQLFSLTPLPDIGNTLGGKSDATALGIDLLAAAVIYVVAIR